MESPEYSVTMAHLQKVVIRDTSNHCTYYHIFWVSDPPVSTRVTPPFLVCKNVNVGFTKMILLTAHATFLSPYCVVTGLVSQASGMNSFSTCSAVCRRAQEFT